MTRPGSRREGIIINIDPVCAMLVQAPDAPEAEFRGAVYRFCCEMCRNGLIERPDRYLKTIKTEEPCTGRAPTASGRW